MLLEAYRWCFARPKFYRFNRKVFNLSLRGLGILNYENSRVSGEHHLLAKELRGRIGTLIDVGANEGAFTALVLQHCPHAHAICFEPHPRTVDRLRQRFAGDRRVRVEHLALGRHSGVMTLHDYVDREGSSHASTLPEVFSEVHRAQSRQVRAPVRPLDEFLEANRLGRIDLIKIDVEGKEYEVLQGMTGLLSTSAPRFILLEFNVMNILARVFLRDIFQLLKEYEFFRLLPRGMIKISNSLAPDNNIFHYQNILAVHAPGPDCGARPRTNRTFRQIFGSGFG